MTITYPTSYANFNNSIPQVVRSNGTVYWPSYVTTFDSTYSQIAPQFKNDMAMLAACGVKLVRIWAGLPTFYMSGGVWQATPNANITNLDDFLTYLGTLGMQALIVILDCPEDISELTTNYLTPAMINDATTQTQYIAAVSNFITRYKNNATIWGYDLNNELSNVPGNGTLFGTVFDVSPFTATSNYCAAVYSAVKAIDSIHYFTFSFASNYNIGDLVVNVIGPYVDFYDEHMYTHNATGQTTSQRWLNFHALDKDIICAEIGTFQVPIDPNTGSSCDVNSFNIAPMHSTYCQQFWRDLVHDHLIYARQNGIKFVCFHAWPTFRWFGIRTDDGNNTWTGHTLTLAGQQVLLSNNHQIAGWI